MAAFANKTVASLLDRHVILFPGLLKYEDEDFDPTAEEYLQEQADPKPRLWDKLVA
uniref:Uncharacterized protein n=1 Tax=Oryza sativa subsp. japonica TaxID=39947 RepID=Q6YTF7_ORYSJ|nr:hypothetical protein [Oryza sativa Japonica Group]BAD17780.1 hypothetical protein [Oryza sativa Japonica Group]